MRRLSSIFKPSLRRWIALAPLTFVAAILVVVWWDAHRRGKFPWMTVAVATPLMGGAYAHVRNALSSGLVDEAWIDGDELLLRRAGQSIRIPLASIAAVEVVRGGLVTLELPLPCVLGARVQFMASGGRHSDITTELRRRVDEARRRLA